MSKRNRVAPLGMIHDVCVNGDSHRLYYSASTGLLTKVRYGGSYEVNYTYDGNGRITKTTDWIDGTDGIRFGFDNAGRLATITDYGDRTLTYAYDAAGQVTSMTDYHGKTTSYSYYPTGQISGLTAPGSKVWSYYYNDIGQITQYTHPNGTTTNYGYDGQHRLTSICHMDGANWLDAFGYYLDTTGNITMTVQGDDDYWLYEYDTGNRLALAQRRNDDQGLLKQFNYTYDLADNMTTKAVYVPGSGTATTVYTFNHGSEAVNQVVNGSSTTNFTYDDWGRTLSKVRDGSTSESYTYRYGGKLYSVTTNFPANSNSTYEYRGDGRMYSRTNAGATTRFNYGAGWQVLTEEATNGTLQMSYVHDFTTPTGLVLADIAGTDPATGTARFYYHDNIDSTRRLRDANKTSLAQYEFDPYGLTYAASGADTPYRWGPYRADLSNSMYYTPNRWYVPMQARWLTRDPLGMVDGPNLYGYCRSNPILCNDQLGENAACIAIGWECAVAEPTPVGECIMFCVTIAWGICKVIQSCSSDDCPSEPPDECEAIYQMDMLMCSLVPPSRRKFCYDQAMQRKSECDQFGAPRSPLPYP